MSDLPPTWASTDPRNKPPAAVPVPVLLGVAALLALAFGGCPGGATGPKLPPIEVIASANPEAEADLRAAREAEARGDTDEAVQRYMAFQEVWPSDPAVGIAQLSLGRIALGRKDNTGAIKWFDQVSSSPDAALAERGHFYGAVARQRDGRHTEALAVLRPMRGRTVDPAETALLLYTIADAEEAMGDLLAALSTRDRMLSGLLDEEDRKTAEAAVGNLVDRLDVEVSLPRAYEVLDRSGYAWPRVARRWLVESYQRSDTETVLGVGHDLDAQGEGMPEDLRELVLRAQRRDAADVRVLGAVLPLSGRGQEVGQSAMRGLMLAAGLPADKPPGKDSFQVIFRDGAGEALASADAVEDLASLHRAVGIIGPVATGAAVAAAGRAADLGVPLLALSPAAELGTIGDRVFRLLPGPAEETRELVAHARAYGVRSVAVLHAENGYGRALRDATQKAVEAAGGVWAGGHSYTAGATSFGDQVKGLVEAAPDAILIADSARQIALIAPALAAVGLWSSLPGEPAPDGRPVMLLLPSAGFSAELASTARRYLQGAVFSVPFDATRGAAAEFADRYREEFGEEPNVFAAYAYDAYNLLTAAVNAGARTRAELADKLVTVRLEDFVGPTSGLSDSRGPVDAVHLQMLIGGAFSPVPQRPKAATPDTAPTARR